MKRDGLLMLSDGTTFWGESVGTTGFFVGEVVFNTSMTGYQEILSDPSYAQQIIAFTYPHIGNVGVNEEDEESDRMWSGGAVMRELSTMPSNWRSKGDLQSALKSQGVVAISGCDTRRLTHILREAGSVHACIMGGKIDADFALAQAQSFLGIEGQNLAQEASTAHHLTCDSLKGPHVVVLDFGVKRSILQKLSDCGCQLTVVPATTSCSDILKLNPKGVVLSNGPGDPAACGIAIETIRALLAANTPLFGICLGHQLLGIASGAKTLKMALGHHGANHPIEELSTGRVFISSQNHGFAVADHGLPSNLCVTHRSLFDGSIAGLARRDKPAFSFQGHPEASPGPQEFHQLFEQFINLMEECDAKTI